VVSEAQLVGAPQHGLVEQFEGERRRRAEPSQKLRDQLVAPARTRSGQKSERGLVVRRRERIEPRQELGQRRVPCDFLILPGPTSSAGTKRMSWCSGFPQLASVALVPVTAVSLMNARRSTNLIRGAAPLGLPRTLSRAPLRRRAPFAWLARCRSLARRRRVV